VVLTQPMKASEEWNAGSMGCGELLVKLHLRMKSLQPGQIFRLISVDPAAPEEMAAWCRLTGNKLIAANHPEYWILRKEIDHAR